MQNETNRGMQINGSSSAQPTSSSAQLASKRDSFRKGRDDWQWPLGNARDPKSEHCLLFQLSSSRQVPSSLQTPGYGDDYRHAWELSAQEQCSVWKKIPSLGQRWVGSLPLSWQLRNKCHLSGRKDCATAAQPGRSACLGNKMSPELCGVIWEHLTPDSICQAVPKGFWLYLSNKCLYPCQTGTETQTGTLPSFQPWP